jgi:hypothetical protein
LYLSVERSRRHRGRRSLVIFATTAIAGLAAAGPALATEAPEPMPLPVVVPEVPTVPEPTELPTIPVPELPPDPIELPVVVADIDAENIDVSIRVLSPGEDKAQEPDETVVSPDAKPDITASHDSSAAEPEEAVKEAVEEAAEAVDPAPIVGAVNTNISIRVLSPGDNEGASQSSTAPDKRAPAEAEPPSGVHSREPSQAATTTAGGDQDSEQYQDDNSQYQYESQITNGPWSWRWLLTVDCAGNATSSSADSGDPGSLDWSWEWIWEWGCGEKGTDSEPALTQGTTSGLSPPPTASDGPTGNATTSSPGPAETGSSAPWNWTWTFTFCGKTTTFTTSAGQGTPLTWAWAWMWNWTCPNTAVGEAPVEAPSAPPAANDTPPFTTSPPAEDGARDTGGVAPLVIGPVAIDVPAEWVPTGADDTPGVAPLVIGPVAIDLPAEWAPTGADDTPGVAPLVIGPVAIDLPAEWAPTGAVRTLPTGIATDVTSLALPAWPTAVGITLDLAIPLAIPQAGSSTIPGKPTPTGAPGSSTTRPSAVAPVPTHRRSSPAHDVLPPLPPASSLETAPRGDDSKSSGSKSSRPAHKGHKEPPRVTRAPPVSLPSIPSVPRSRHGFGSASAGGTGTSALLVGVAALTGFALLVAPGLGRRIRVARELSPGSPDSPPIDHPG